MKTMIKSRIIRSRLSAIGVNYRVGYRDAWIVWRTIGGDLFDS